MQTREELMARMEQDIKVLDNQIGNLMADSAMEISKNRPVFWDTLARLYGVQAAVKSQLYGNMYGFIKRERGTEEYTPIKKEVKYYGKHKAIGRLTDRR